MSDSHGRAVVRVETTPDSVFGERVVRMLGIGAPAELTDFLNDPYGDPDKREICQHIIDIVKHRASDFSAQDIAALKAVLVLLELEGAATEHRPTLPDHVCAMV